MKELDLESLGFQQRRPHPLANLPEGSQRRLPEQDVLFPNAPPQIIWTGYEAVHVPAPKLAPLDGRFRIASMPDWAQPAFEEMISLNQVQSKVYQTALFKSDNMLLCAPTGAGKTTVAILTILQQMGLNRNPDGSFNHENYKIVYLAPVKAVVAQIVDNLSNRLSAYKVNVKELSGVQTLTRQQIEEIQIIVTTPEKWDIMTRHSGDRTYTQMVKLLIIDDIHLLHDNRGPVLESIVARTNRQIDIFGQPIRLVGLSATLPNYQDIALFLRVDLNNGLFHFDNTYRNAPLEQLYRGIIVKKPLERSQLMNNICVQLVTGMAGTYCQCVIFVQSMDETVKTARAIREYAHVNPGMFLREDSREILASNVDLVENNDLKDLLPYGLAVHHAGMTRNDRRIVEDLFRNFHVQVLVSTPTLAWSVNLASRTVLIKGTKIYNPEKGEWTELSPLYVMQMLGRAEGRYKLKGEGIIITDHDELEYHISLMNQQLPIESHFISKLADQLNAEIVLGSVQNAREALNWLGYTYLYFRMLDNPRRYGLPLRILSKDILLKDKRADLVHSAATLLDKINLVKYDRKSGYFQSTELGRIASHCNIKHRTIATYNEHLKPTMSDNEVYWLISLSEEFKFVTIRLDERMELANLLDRVPIPMKKSVKESLDLEVCSTTISGLFQAYLSELKSKESLKKSLELEDPSAKTIVLLQAYLCELKVEGHSLRSDMEYIAQSAGRLLRALFEIVLKRGWARLAEKTFILSKMVNKRMWNDQKDLAWEGYYDLSAQGIEDLPEMGGPLPKLNLAAHVKPITRTVLRLELTVTPKFMWDDKVHGYVEPFWVIVEDHDRKYIIHHEYFMLKKQYHDEVHVLNFTVPIDERLPPRCFIRVVSDRWLESQTVLPVSFRLPKKYPPPTELLDLQPLPVTALRNPSYEALYHELKQFNPVQTQVFNVLYNSDENVLVAAPTGSGKTICAEFAILRNHQMGPESVMRAVYIAPIEALAKERYRDWEAKFGKGLELRVVELTGETTTDIKLLEKGQIIISTPEKWDALSRRREQRKYVQQVSLFIIDELHLIGDQGGPVLEVIISRMRYIDSQIQNKIRIVALATSLANAEDLGNWIGATSHSLFNFPPGVRPVPLEIHIQKVDIANYEARMQAMTKPTYTAIKQHAKKGKPAIVFVPTWKHVRLTAVDLKAYSRVEGGENPEFLLQPSDKLQPFIEKINEEMLKDTLSHGVGYLHEGLTSVDQEVVSYIFKAGLIQVCVMASSMCWGMPLTAHLVIVMGTQYYDARETAHTDYPVSDLLQMMGHASRPKLDTSGKCVILCHAPRKDYYKKFLNEAFPVESHLQHYLHDNLNAEVVAGVIVNKQDAVNYLTWTFMYRRLTQNPNYYSLQGVSRSYDLSELLDNTLSELEACNFVAIEDDMVLLSPLNLGMIASYYYISYTTIKRFSSSLTANTKMKGLLEIICSASEYSQLPLRPGEEDEVRRLMNQQRFSPENPKYTDPHLKANVLLQAHFSRHNVGGNLALDLREVLLSATRLIQAIVDVISSSEWLNLALLAMELSQMVVQGMWEGDFMLLQLPHFTKELAKTCQENPNKSIQTVFDLAEIKDDEKRHLLQMSDSQLLDIARFCNRFPPIIGMTCQVMNAENIHSEEDITLQVQLERDMNGRTDVGPVDATRYPKSKEEGWWLVVGDTTTNQLLSIKRVTLQGKSMVKLNFSAPAEAGKKSYTLYIKCDSYKGCDQEYNFTIDVKESAAMDEDEYAAMDEDGAQD